ncbi:hypothetical protein HYW99_00345 [Candidatus Woesearchaeota archaeon]|nr:hypothetical protein [Candidatus Woesearchaeota archaeon]
METSSLTIKTISEEQVYKMAETVLIYAGQRILVTPKSVLPPRYEMSHTLQFRYANFPKNTFAVFGDVHIDDLVKNFDLRGIAKLTYNPKSFDSIEISNGMFPLSNLEGLEWVYKKYNSHPEWKSIFERGDWLKDMIEVYESIVKSHELDRE